MRLKTILITFFAFLMTAQVSADEQQWMQIQQDNLINQLPANKPVQPQDGDIRTQVWQRIENNVLFSYTLKKTYRVQGDSGRWVTTLTSKQYIKDVPPKAADGID